jgi:hypothetical protein
MSVTKPFRRTCRQFVDGTYADSGKWMYILHPKFAKEPEHYVRAFNLIQKDLFELFDYIEPSDQNLECYSYRTHALHLRTCIEIEANFKAILRENGYARRGNWKIDTDYRKLETTHLLYAYEIKIPVWQGTTNARMPFAPWSTNARLDWYQAYNDAKHDRHDKFSRANFGNLLDAICGLIVILSAQFYTQDFSPAAPTLALSGMGGPPWGYESAIGGYFYVKFPNNWPSADRYDFDWQSLRQQTDPFQTLTL